MVQNHENESTMRFYLIASCFSAGGATLVVALFLADPVDDYDGP